MIFFFFSFQFNDDLDILLKSIEIRKIVSSQKLKYFAAFSIVFLIITLQVKYYGTKTQDAIGSETELEIFRRNRKYNTKLKTRGKPFTLVQETARVCVPLSDLLIRNRTSSHFPCLVIGLRFPLKSGHFVSLSITPCVLVALSSCWV